MDACLRSDLRISWKYNSSTDICSLGGKIDALEVGFIGIIPHCGPSPPQTSESRAKQEKFQSKFSSDCYQSLVQNVVLKARL